MLPIPPSFFTADGLSSTFKDLAASLANKKSTPAREGACISIKALASKSTADLAPFLLSLLPAVLAAAGDKQVVVKKAAEQAALAIAEDLNPNAVKAALPHVIRSLGTASQWTEKVTDLKVIETLCKTCPVQMGYRVPELIPAVSEAMWDTKKDVKTKAHTTMEKICELIVNKDIERFIPELIKCVSKPENVPATIHLLGATTFVSEVLAPTLSLMTPLLERGLAERDTAVKRKAAVIIDNMCKLVESPAIVAPFLSKLMPALEKNHDTLADPEAREKTKAALDTLVRVGHVEDGKIPVIELPGDISTVLPIVKDVLRGADDNVAMYVAAVCAQLAEEATADHTSWAEQVGPYVEVHSAVDMLRKRVSPGAAEEDSESDDDDDNLLCNCEFSLAYGAKIILNRTRLKLKRGARYGILGVNGCGKTTLMRAINNEQVEGFPKQSEVKTVYVEHDLDAGDTEQTVIEWTMKKLAAVGVEKAQADVETKLVEFGFTADQVAASITSLSGGWRMKLALARAVFEEPDILLLDEPTNHLDVRNVAWLEDYLMNSPCTSLIISHDSKFLDNVIQHVIHFERFKLRTYRGNLNAFVEKVPAAKAYHDIADTDLDFKFPEPGFLEGVKTKAKAIVRVKEVCFQYPNTPKPQLSNVNFQVSLGSRICVIGPNGAGKSTLINVLTGELIATSGEVYHHENIRIAYIKQHAFAHIESHLEKTPSEYIQWRYRTGEDRETMDRANKTVTEDDEQSMLKIFTIEYTKRRVIGVHGRRKYKNSYEYECSFTLGENVGQKTEKWTPMMTSDNAWIPRSELIGSHQKMVSEVDQKEALASGQFRPLVRREIEEHCRYFGLDNELVSHSQLKGLSGGQRIKVVLAACSWLRPHVIVLDEPTNYLDRDSLGALAKALKAFEGGVVLITHAEEFTRNLTEEVWSVVDGNMTPSGHNWVSGQGAGPRLDKKEGDGEGVDEFGNKVKMERKKKLTSNEARKKRKDRMARRKKGEEVFSDEE